MAFIGNQPISVAFLTDTFSGTGAQVAFTMTVAPANTSSIIVAVTGVVQDPSTYSVSGTTLTFSAAPPSGTSNISVRYLGIPASGVTTTAYRTVTNTTATASQTSFAIPSYTVGYVDVYRNGVYLPTTDYTATTGTTVVLNTGATSGDTITTISFFVSSVLNAVLGTNGSSIGQTLISPNITTSLTLSSASGTNGQYLTSAGSGNAPTWTTGVSLTTPSFTTTIGVGAATAAASGAGITFPATQSDSSNVNTLDDYEEGTWTPSVGGNATYTAQNGKYTKVGRMVTISCYMGTNNIGTGSTTVISGLPFTCSTYGGDYAGVQTWSNLANSFTALNGNIQEANTIIRFIGLIGGTANITNSSGSTVFGNNADIALTGTYFV